MFGSVSQWFINWLGGIQPATDAVGFDRIVIRPQTVPELQWVKSSYDSVRGRIVSNWSRERGRLQFEIEIPANTTAEIYLPARSSGTVTEGGKSIAKAKGITLLREEPGTTVLAVCSGCYRFTVQE